MDPEKRRRISREGGRASLRGIARREVEDYDDENYEDDDYEDPQNRYEDDEDYDPYEPEDEYDDEDDDRDDDRRNVYGEGDDYDDDEGYADEYDDEDENYQDERHRSRGRDGRGFASMPREEVRRIARGEDVPSAVAEVAAEETEELVDPVLVAAMNQMDVVRQVVPGTEVALAEVAAHADLHRAVAVSQPCHAKK